jgi:hypothetical protein
MLLVRLESSGPAAKWRYGRASSQVTVWSESKLNPVSGRLLIDPAKGLDGAEATRRLEFRDIACAEVGMARGGETRMHRRSSRCLATSCCTDPQVRYHDEVSDRKHLKRLVCYPQGTTIGDGRTAFLAWAKENAGNAKRMDEVPVVGLVRALANAYPCK